MVAYTLPMKYLAILIVFVGIVSWSVPISALADSDAVWRVQIEEPEPTPAPTGFWARVSRLLGARVTRPSPGTKIVVQSSAYASSPYQTDNTPCITAAGTRVRQGVVATNFLPMGTILSINGDHYIVEDRMSSRYQGKYLDIWFPSTAEALEFGRRKLEIQVVEYGTPGQELTATTPKKPGVLKRASLQFLAMSAKVAAVLPANVNRFDIDCSQK